MSGSDIFGLPLCPVKNRDFVTLQDFHGCENLAEGLGGCSNCTAPRGTRDCWVDSVVKLKECQRYRGPLSAILQQLKLQK